MASDSVAKTLGTYPTGNLCNAHFAVTAMHPRIMPLFAGARLAGPARTVRIDPGQNAAIHRAVHLSEPGEVLVVDAGASRYFGPFGDILTTACMQRGVAGLVIDGMVRDSAEIIALGFPVFCLGRNPAATAKTERGAVNVEIRCGDAPVKAGDIVVGDADGVVVVPAEIAPEVAERVVGVATREEGIVSQLKAGKTTYEVFGLSSLYEDPESGEDPQTS